MNKVSRFIISKRITILAITGAAIYISISHFMISLWYVLAFGAVTGLIFGKVFCRWMCPVGLIMEMMMNLNKNESARQMYQYHKLGCPIAWISGLLNRFSLFKIKFNKNTCKTCGICDKECYIVAMAPEKYSLYKKAKEQPGFSYTCSKCLKCVAVCPNGSLSYKI